MGIIRDGIGGFQKRFPPKIWGWQRGLLPETERDWAEPPWGGTSDAWWGIKEDTVHRKTRHVIYVEIMPSIKMMRNKQSRPGSGESCSVFPQQRGRAKHCCLSSSSVHLRKEENRAHALSRIGAQHQGKARCGGTGRRGMWEKREIRIHNWTDWMTL